MSDQHLFMEGQLQNMWESFAVARWHRSHRGDNVTDVFASLALVQYSEIEATLRDPEPSTD